MNDDYESGAPPDPPGPPPHCSSCTCGQIQLTWSDREAWVDPENLDAVTGVILNCALDHSYDRGTGVPYGFVRGVYEALYPIIEQHLSAARPDWKQHTVTMNAEQRAAFQTAIRDTLHGLRKPLA